MVFWCCDSLYYIMRFVQYAQFHMFHWYTGFPLQSDVHIFIVQLVHFFTQNPPVLSTNKLLKV